MTVLDLFDGDVTFLLERSVQTVVECNTNVILKSQFVLGENFGLYSANSLTHTSIVLLSVSLYFFAFGFIPHTYLAFAAGAAGSSLMPSSALTAAAMSVKRASSKNARLCADVSNTAV